MPKRIIDGEALWQSDKLGQVKPVRFRAEYANLIPLALANGSFECNSRAIWAKVYATNRPDITVDDVSQILDEFERVTMLIRWQEDGKVWGYWIGIDKLGRLPKQSAIKKKHYVLGPEPPGMLLSSVATVGRQCGDNGAVGIGIGSGIGKTITSTPEASSAALRAEEDASATKSTNQNHIALSGSPLNSAKHGVSGLVFSSSPSDEGLSPRSLCAAELKRQMRSKRNGGTR